MTNNQHRSRWRRATITLLALVASIALTIACCAVTLNRIAGFPLLANPLTARHADPPGAPGNDPWLFPKPTPRPTKQRLPIAGTSVAAVKATLPVEWYLVWQPPGLHDSELTYYGEGKVESIGARALLDFDTVGHRDSDPVSGLSCRFLNPDLKLDRKTAQILDTCAASVLPPASQPAAFAWVAKTMPAMTVDQADEDRPLGPINLHLHYSFGEIGITVSATVASPSAAPSATPASPTSS